MNLFNQPKPWEADNLSDMPRRNIVAADEGMDITPMIDITFLLLIFFIVASKMDTGTDVILPTARNGVAVTIDNSSVLTMLGGDPDFVDVYRGHDNDLRRIDAIDPIVQEQLIGEYVESQLNTEPPKRQVIIRADKDVKHREVSRILRAVGRVAGVSAYVAVLEDR